MTTTKGRELALKLSRITPKIPMSILLEYCSSICRISTSLHNISERQCTEDMGEKEYARLEAKEEKLQKRVAEYIATLSEFAGYDMQPVFSGDPRGAVIKIALQKPYDIHHV